MPAASREIRYAPRTPGAAPSYLTTMRCVTTGGSCPTRRTAKAEVYGGAVLSGWQTVVVSLGAAFMTGSFAILVARLNIRAQRREQFRVRRVEAASDFSKRFIGASDAVRYSIDHPDDRAAADNAPHLTGEVTPLLGPLSLLFGTGSEADRAARAALDDLRRASEAVKAREGEHADEHLAESDVSRARFEAAVRDVVG